MYQVLVVLLFWASGVFAQGIGKNTQANSMQLQSYSYTLMDELKLNLVQDVKEAKPKSSTNNPKTSNIKHFYYEPYCDFLDVKNTKQLFDKHPYSFGKFSAKLTSDLFNKNTLTNTSSFRVGYEIAPGITPYLETKYINKPQKPNGMISKNKRSGLFLIGTKIEF